MNNPRYIVYIKSVFAIPIEAKSEKDALALGYLQLNNNPGKYKPVINVSAKRYRKEVKNEKH